MDSADSAFAYCLSEKTPSISDDIEGVCYLFLLLIVLSADTEVRQSHCGQTAQGRPQTADIAGFRNAGRRSLAVGNIHCLRFIRRLGLCFRLGRRNLAVRDVLRRLQRIKRCRLIRNVNRRLRIGIGSRFRVRLVVTAAATAAARLLNEHYLERIWKAH